MREKFKSIASAVLAVCICIGMTGCENDKDKDLDNISEKDFIKNAEKLETLYEEEEDGNSAEAEDDLQEATTTAESTEEEYKIVLSDEIKNADFSSGLIQINNEIFQQGGYITVADFVEKYKDSYDITYKDGTYEERTDYLIAYDKSTHSSSTSYHRTYSLTLTPKLGNEKNKVLVYVANLTSYDEKIPLSEALVIYCEPVSNKGGTLDDVYTPAWFSNGFSSWSHYYVGDKDLERANTNYKRKDFIEYIEGQGFELSNTPNISIFPDIKQMNLNTIDVDKKYYEAFGYIYIISVGEPNHFGARPIFTYCFKFNSDTDQLEDDVTFSIRGFIGEKTSE